MSIGAYLKDRAIHVFAAFFCAAGVALLLATSGASAHLAMLAAAFVLACFAVALTLDYARRYRFYRDLMQTVRSLDEAYLASSLVPEPDFPEGSIAWSALDAACKSAGDHVACAQRQAAEYREYVELWIHEVKTPIAAAVLAADRVGGREGSKVKAELSRIESYVEQALYYARSTSLAQDYVIREIDLGEAVRAVCRKNARYLVECGVSASVEVACSTTVLADEKWLSFLLGQVVVNAAKYGAGKIRFTAEGGRPASRQVTLRIADDGVGIPAADVPRVFDRGFTGRNGRAQGSSTGMGLYLAAVMCDKMHLGLQISSEEGRGTCVSVTFPLDGARMDAMGREGASS